MKPWRDLTDSEKVERLGATVALLQQRINKVDPPIQHPGYEMLEIKCSPEQEDDYLPIYGGNLSKKVA